jgi:hypothetical protein
MSGFFEVVTDGGEAYCAVLDQNCDAPLHLVERTRSLNDLTSAVIVPLMGSRGV